MSVIIRAPAAPATTTTVSEPFLADVRATFLAASAGKAESKTLSAGRSQATMRGCCLFAYAIAEGQSSSADRSALYLASGLKSGSFKPMWQAALWLATGERLVSWHQQGDLEPSLTGILKLFDTYAKVRRAMSPPADIVASLVESIADLYPDQRTDLFTMLGSAYSEEMLAGITAGEALKAAA